MTTLAEHVLFVTPTDDADQRTRNRLRENGPFFTIQAGPCFHTWQNCRSVKMKSTSTSWWGWFPTDFVEWRNA